MTLHPICVECRAKNVAPRDIIDQETGDLLYRRGDFIKKCKGFSVDPEENFLHNIDLSIRRKVDDDDLFRKMGRMNDPMLWAEDNITVLDTATGIRGPWRPQGASSDNVEKYGLSPESYYYQEAMVRCNAQLQAYRVGRRAGKSWTLTIKILHKMYTEPKYKVLVITPHIAQLDLIFDLAKEYITNSPTLKEGVFRAIKTPQRRIELPNGSFMVGFVSGSEAVRGQSANMIVIDETDYLTTDDLSAVAAILSEHKDSILLAASTPSGARETFYNWNHDPEFKAFHFPSMARPTWDLSMEQKQKKLNEYPSAKYDHEILAEFGEMSQGVFQNIHIERALAGTPYSYLDSRREKSWQYVVGIDWNPINGTEAYVLGRDPKTEKVRAVDKIRVFREGNTQIDSLREIIALNRKWEPMAIFADIGAGSTQIQILNEFGRVSPEGTADKSLQYIIRAIDFGSKIEMTDPASNELVKTYAKPAVVESAVRFFENEMVELTKLDEDLERQLKGYIIVKQNGTRPVYGMITDGIPDHALDAFMLGLFAITMNFTAFGEQDFVHEVAFSKSASIMFDDQSRFKSRKIEKKEEASKWSKDLTSKISPGDGEVPFSTLYTDSLVKTWENGILKRALGAQKGPPIKSRSIRGR